ncbi:hypothetical protein [Curtobacterium sp. 9128]|uniref:hypothetical protein n=1 Tax=Curtobacterium sp. 9128 TaxID=1793722 RepID=UPI0011A9280D|nr:hypothetical protein [Curtobacterium sp. 9128]
MVFLFGRMDGPREKNPPRSVRVAFWLFIVGASLRLIAAGSQLLAEDAGHGHVQRGGAAVDAFGLLFSAIFAGLTVVVVIRFRQGSRVARVLLLVVVVFSLLIAPGPNFVLLLLPAVVSACAVVMGFTRSANEHFKESMHRTG